MPRHVMTITNEFPGLLAQRTQDKWCGPDMGGAYWLEGNDMNQAVVAPDPTGETEHITWAVLIDEYATSVAEGWALTEEQAKQAAETALKTYEGSN